MSNIVPDKRLILKDKDPGFQEDTRIEGNLSVVAHPNDPTYYGDGSIEVNGVLRTDALMSATPNTVVYVASPLNFKPRATRPTELPQSGEIQIYADPESEGRLVMVDSLGSTIDVNPIKKIGDLMTFDALENTTVRLPAGLPGQTLRCDPLQDFRTGLAWKSDYAAVHNITVPSDGFARYMELGCNTAKNLTGSPTLIPFNHVLRCDRDAFSPSSYDFITLQAGVYEISGKITFTLDVELATAGTPVAIEWYIEESDPGGYTVAPGSNNFGSTTTFKIDNGSASVSGKTILQLDNASRVRVMCREIGTVTGLLRIVPPLCTLSVRKLALGNPSGDSSEYFTSTGLLGARPLLISDYTVLQINTPVVRTNNSDSFTTNSPRVANPGRRVIFGKAAFESNNTTTTSTATIETIITVNGIALSNSSSVCQLYGNEVSSSSIVGPIVIDLAENDVIGLSSRLNNRNTTDGSINIVSEQCYLAIEKFDTDIWKGLYATSDSSLQLQPNQFQFVSGETVNTNIGDEFSSFNGGSKFAVKRGGTVSYTFSCVVDNTDLEPYYAYFTLLANLGEGEKEVPGSGSVLCILPGCAQTVCISGTAYLKPQSSLAVSALALHGGNVIVRDNSAKLLLEKIENTISPFTGDNGFGRFWKYVEDPNEVYTTSTDFSPRMSAATISLTAGKYRLGFSFEYDMTDPGVAFETQLVLDNTVVLETYNTTPLFTGQFQKITTFKEIDLAGGEHRFDFSARVAEPAQALVTRNVRLELFAT